MALTFYNTLTRQDENFTPQNSDSQSVSLYTCGPTVYNYPHIGNYRAYLFGDILKRTLVYSGLTVRHVMNITDIDDKTIRDSQKEGKTLKEFTEFYTNEFFKDRDALGILPADIYTKATDYVTEMVEMIESLLEKGVAYKEPDGSVYFDIKKFPEYGKLAHVDLSELKDNASGRIKKDEYEKENAQDFALWKAWDETDGDVFWETSLGKGRPGWHIECSAMSTKELGNTIDIHTGGVDNIFPHHENEIAQSECATGTSPFVRYWMHCAHLMVDGKKMAKSAGNFYTLRDITSRGYNPLVFRYLTLSTHYRSPLNFTWEALDGARYGLANLHNYFRSLTEEATVVSEKYEEKFLTALENDLNTSSALAIVSEVRHDMTLVAGVKKATLLDFDRVLGLGLGSLEEETVPEEVLELSRVRQEARIAKNWPLSDELREKIEALGYSVKDTEKGSSVSKIF